MRFEATHYFQAARATFASGAHVAVVEDAARPFAARVVATPLRAEDVFRLLRPASERIGP